MGRYFFSKDKWVKDMECSCDGYTWLDDADNCEVVFYDGETEWGFCCDDDGYKYAVHRDWCETVDGIDLTGEHVDKMWIGVKNAIAEEGVPCGMKSATNERN